MEHVPEDLVKKMQALESWLWINGKDTLTFM